MMKRASGVNPHGPRSRSKRTKIALLGNSPELSESLTIESKRILVVDDDPGVRTSLGDVLLTEGYAVFPAKDGQQAVELARSTEVDLVLLDLNMPVKNGWDTFEQLTREHPLVPIIIVTARPNQFFTALAAGAGALMEKPMDIPTLLRTIKRLLSEPPETRLARLAGRETDFHYFAARKSPAA